MKLVTLFFANFLLHCQGQEPQYDENLAAVEKWVQDVDLWIFFNRRESQS